MRYKSAAIGVLGDDAGRPQLGHAPQPAVHGDDERSRCHVVDTPSNMDFDDTPEEAAFRAEARGWLEAHATAKDPDASDRLTAARVDPTHVERCREWQRTLYEGGWAGIA